MDRVAARWDVEIENLVWGKYEFKDVDFRKLSDGGETILISRRSENGVMDEDHDTCYELYIDCALPQFTYMNSNYGTLELEAYIEELLYYPDGKVVIERNCPGGEYCWMGMEHGIGRYTPPKMKGFKSGVYRVTLHNYGVV